VELINYRLLNSVAQILLEWISVGVFNECVDCGKGVLFPCDFVQWLSVQPVAPFEYRSTFRALTI
jgi:hypothetical protein